MALHSLDSLRCFLAAARLHNFTKAARVVALTPAAFGQRIKQLEEHLGAPLFLRTTRRVHLTEAGMAVKPWAERCLSAADNCLQAAHGDAELPPLELVIGTRHELGMSWLMPQLGSLSRVRQGLRLHLYVGSGSDLLLRTRSLEIDCAITSSRFSDPLLDAIRLHREDYVFCAANKLLKEVPLSTPAQASRHTLLDISPELPLFRYWKDAPKGGDRLEFRNVTHLGGTDMLLSHVLHGHGIAVLPEYLARSHLQRRTLRRLFPSVKPLHDYFRLVFRVRDPRRPVFSMLADSLMAHPLR